jgi:hypothetical protein
VFTPNARSHRSQVYRHLPVRRMRLFRPAGDDTPLPAVDRSRPQFYVVSVVCPSADADDTDEFELNHLDGNDFDDVWNATSEFAERLVLPVCLARLGALDSELIDTVAFIDRRPFSIQMHPDGDREQSITVVSDSGGM